MNLRPHLIVSAILSSSLTLPATAQIANGGFEDPSSPTPQLAEWQYFGGNRDSVFPRTGLFSANLNNTSTALAVRAAQQSTSGVITPGTEYTLAYFAAATYGVSGIGQVQFAFLNADGNNLPGSPQFFDIAQSTAYLPYSRILIAPANASGIFISVNAVTGAVTGASSQVFIDDVSFSAAVIPEPAALSLLALPTLALLRRRT